MGPLARDIEEYVQQKLSSGEFSSREEFLSDAIRAYQERERGYEEFRAEARCRIEQADRGEVSEFNIEAIIAELEEELDEQGQPKQCRA